MNRVKFYSVTDWGSGNQLKKAEKVINDFDKNKEYEIEDILEFYNITKYIDSKMYLEQWNKEYIEEINKIVKEMREKIFKYIDDNVNEEKFEEILIDYGILNTNEIEFVKNWQNNNPYLI